RGPPVSRPGRLAEGSTRGGERQSRRGWPSGGLQRALRDPFHPVQDRGPGARVAVPLGANPVRIPTRKRSKPLVWAPSVTERLPVRDRAATPGSILRLPSELKDPLRLVIDFPSS